MYTHTLLNQNYLGINGEKKPEEKKRILSSDVLAYNLVI